MNRRLCIRRSWGQPETEDSVSYEFEVDGQRSSCTCVVPVCVQSSPTYFRIFLDSAFSFAFFAAKVTFES